MRHGSLFSGIGGFDLAAEWMGWENVFHCEWNEFGQKVLKYYWPNATSYEDITKTDFSSWRGRIDILTGGFPCQPFSLAGKRKGTEDDRHLWPEMLRAIQEIKPTWIVGENVFGIVSWDGGLVFKQVQVDLETEGYEVQPYVLPACAVNAPHRRDRVWFVAKNTMQNGRRSDERKSKPNIGELRHIGSGNNEWIQADNGKAGTTADTEGLRINRTQEHEDNSGQGGERRRCDSDNACKIQRWDVTSHARNQRLEGGKVNRSIGRIREKPNKQPPRCIRTTWQEFPTVSPLCNRNDGLSDRISGITFSKWRNESIKAMGNAIVPQIAFQIFKAIEAVNNFVENNTYR